MKNQLKLILPKLITTDSIRQATGPVSPIDESVSYAPCAILRIRVKEQANHSSPPDASYFRDFNLGLTRPAHGELRGAH